MKLNLDVLPSDLEKEFEWLKKKRIVLDCMFDKMKQPSSALPVTGLMLASNPLLSLS
jgi:hypothetical protein